MKHQLLSPPKNHIIYRKKLAERVKVKVRGSQTYRENAQVKITVENNIPSIKIV